MYDIGPVNSPMVFFRTAWMTAYRGAESIEAQGGGAFVNENGFGYEMFNFLPFNGRCYGYVQPVSRNREWQKSIIGIERLGAASGADWVDGIQIVWCATHPTIRGVRVCGWYDDARVYRRCQEPPDGAQRYSPDGQNCWYFAVANARGCTLLPPSERNLELPGRGFGGFGQSNVLYADDPNQHLDMRRKVLKLIEAGAGARVAKSPTTSGSAFQPDLLKREQVERAAEAQAMEFLRKELGFEPIDVSAENLGWDILATRGDEKLFVEVKGLSGSNLAIELTPNEYRAMQEHQQQFRLCVVINALTAPKVEFFAYAERRGEWESRGGRVLRIEERTAARCSA